MNLVVDANVVVKWYVAEERSDLASRLLDGDDLLVAPGHLLGEVGEVLLRKYLGGAISARQLEVAKIALPGSFLPIPVEDLFARALDLALDADVSVYDALYLSAAERWQTVLITDDKRMLRKLVGSPSASLAASLRDWGKAFG